MERVKGGRDQAEIDVSEWAGARASVPVATGCEEAWDGCEEAADASWGGCAWVDALLRYSWTTLLAGYWALTSPLSPSRTTSTANPTAASTLITGLM